MKFNATKSQKSKKGLCSLEFQLVELADKITFPFFMASLIGNENDANSFLCHLSPFDRPDLTAGMWGCKILWGMYGSQFQANVVPNLAFGECYLSFCQMSNFLDIHSYILHKLYSLWKNVDQIELVTWTQQGFQASARAQFLKKLSKLSKSETRERVSDLSQIYLRRTGAAASSVLPAFCWLALQLFFCNQLRSW